MQLLTPRPGTYMRDPKSGTPLTANVDTVSSDHELVKCNRGKWMTPTPGSPAAGATVPTVGAPERVEEVAVPKRAATKTKAVEAKDKSE